jgi:hypothetical protein
MDNLNIKITKYEDRLNLIRQEMDDLILQVRDHTDKHQNVDLAANVGDSFDSRFQLSQ